MLTYERNGKTYAIDEESIPATATMYLLQYGWAQSLQDSIAGLAKAVRDEYVAKATEAGTEPDEAEITEAINATIDGQLMKRADAIKAGTVGSRVGVSRDPFATMVRKVAREWLLKALKAANTKVPKDKEKVDELISTLISRNRAKVEAEAKRRMESESIEIEL